MLKPQITSYRIICRKRKLKQSRFAGRPPARARGWLLCRRTPTVPTPRHRHEAPEGIYKSRSSRTPAPFPQLIVCSGVIPTLWLNWANLHELLGYTMTDWRRFSSHRSSNFDVLLPKNPSILQSLIISMKYFMLGTTIWIAPIPIAEWSKCLSVRRVPL